MAVKTTAGRAFFLDGKTLISYQRFSYWLLPVGANWYLMLPALRTAAGWLLTMAICICATSSESSSSQCFLNYLHINNSSYCDRNRLKPLIIALISYQIRVKHYK